MIEPYADVLAQEAWYSGDGVGKEGVKRNYVFDSLDASRDWQDQFAGRARNLPYSWYGVTPGLRNVFRSADERGHLRTIFDVDTYASVQFNKASHTAGDKYHRLAKLGEPNYGNESPYFVPGARLRWMPTRDVTFGARGEYDTDAKRLTFADLKMDHVLTRRLRYNVGLVHRDHRWWDYSSAPYNAKTMRSEGFNWARFSYLDLGFEYDIVDAVAVGPYIRYDLRYDEVEEVGSWFDYRTDCLGFRLQIAYENDYKRIDGSTYEHDWRVGFYVYLRAFGPGMGDILGD